MALEEYVPAKEAAEIIGINYELLMARCHKGKVKFVKNGWAVFIHKDEVAREKREQEKRDRSKPKE